MPSPKLPTRPLPPAAVSDVLRYWHASLRLEEALSARPRARTSPLKKTTPHLETPTPGQDYFKLPLSGDGEALVQRGGGLLRPFDGELCAFFEHYLHDQYRRGAEDEGHLLCFPIIVLPRGELLSLLRLPVRLRFLDERKEPFAVPTRRQRTRRELPPPPSHVHVVRTERSEGDFPYFLDTRVLNQQLGLESATIDELFSALREDERLSEARMLATLLRFVERDLPEARGAVDEDSLLASRLAQAVQDRLDLGGTSLRAYPFGIIVSAAQAKVTWHLQQDLTLLSRSLDQAPWPADVPLSHYLGGEPARPLQGLQRALAEGPALTPVQRDVAEHFWGSRLTSVQGPPGTGKTTLLQHLAAEFLVRKVEGLIDHGRMGEDTLALVSSNNRAVDNALAPFMADEASANSLPLALRAGSRQACEHLLARQLRRAAVFLADALTRPQDERAGLLEAAKARFVATRSAVAEGMQERANIMGANAERAVLQHELDSLPTSPAPGRRLRPTWPKALLSSGNELLKRLEELEDLCDARPSVATLSTVARHFERTRKRQLSDFEDHATGAGVSLKTKLPPDLPPSIDPAALMNAWQHAAATAAEELTDMLSTQAALAEEAALAQRRGALQRKVDALGAVLPVPPGSAREEDMRALFLNATEVLQAWARCEAERLGNAVERTLHAVTESRSLRSIYREEPETWAALRQLFGLWGSTLLSLGNCFPPHGDALSRVIIDEAGQCHPAHAVSGLMRCQAALVIGDVHQLPPVIELTPEDDRRVVQQAIPGQSAPSDVFRVHNQSHVSAQSLADEAVAERLRLVDHFRCQPEIIHLCDRLSNYDLQVHTERRSLIDRVPELAAPVLWWDVVGEQSRSGGSLYNRAEMDAVQGLLDRLLQRGIPSDEIAVITPFRGQLEQLRHMAAACGIPVERTAELAAEDGMPRPAGHGLAIGTVHRFQGGERSVVLFTMTASKRRSLRFLNERPNLMNVAISRARDHLICIGDRALAREGRVTAVLSEQARPFRLT